VTQGPHADGAPGAEELRRLAVALVPGGRIVGCEPLRSTTGDDVVRKEAGYGRPWRLAVDDGQGIRTLVFRTASADEFGHDRRADRASNQLLAFDTFGLIPRHVRALDVGAVTPRGLVSLRDAGELYLVTSYAEGQLYAADLQRIARERAIEALDLERCEVLARFLVDLHRERIVDEVGWRRAVRDLLGHGEGIFGIADAYPAGVPAASPRRLARIERRCLAWRWRLRPQVERLRRTHGDFHPFNIVFSSGARFTLLDASRGCAGDAADDVTALAVNYVFFALQARDAWAPALGPLWRRFWEVYLAAAGREVLRSAAPYLAWRALVLGCPRFYPDLPAAARDALLGLAERALAAEAFEPAWAEDLFR
jgi:aminoglycoside phosphotransferase (APT) family kinase protein